MQPCKLRLQPMRQVFNPSNGRSRPARVVRPVIIVVIAGPPGGPTTIIKCAAILATSRQHADRASAAITVPVSAIGTPAPGQEGPSRAPRVQISDGLRWRSPGPALLHCRNH